MGKRFIYCSVFAFVTLCSFVSSKPGSTEKPDPCIQTSTTNLCKDSVLENELCLLSDKLGIKLDTSCDTRLMSTLADWLGTPYHHAGYSKKGTDCSGFVSAIYKEVYGINLTHSSRSMIYQMKEKVKKEDLQTGDILFFKIHGKRKGISHVGIYLKDGMFIHASLYNGVSIGCLNCKYYIRAYYAAGRLSLNNKLALSK